MQCTGMGVGAERRSAPAHCNRRTAVLGETISESSLIFDDGLQILGTSAKVSGDSLGIIDEAL